MGVILLLTVGCGGGGGGGASGLGGSESANFGCTGGCTNLNLSSAEVTRLVQQAVAGAELLKVKATVAVVDRVGNVLAIYQMAGAAASTTINGAIGAVGGLEGASVPATLAAISKAGTGAYLSSQGNAFSTRTASQIIQENFNPGEIGAPGGPLFGVQFSQLPCSDVTQSIGPRPLPLGLSADPGGVPLYKEGDLVGGIGIEIDGTYRLDRDLRDYDDDIEERVALLASQGFEAPAERIADAIYVAGKSLRFVDLSYDSLETLPAELPALRASELVAVPPFFSGTIRAGVTFGTVASGIADTVRAGVPSMVLVDSGGNYRVPTIAGRPMLGGVQLKTDEVDAILDAAILTASRARAAIRRPLDDNARVSIWVIDIDGNPLGFTRTQDAPVFGIDVALQKARAAALFSAADAGAVLSRIGFGGYVQQVRAFLGPDALTGKNAISNRAVGNMARPFLPDGIPSARFGPLSYPFPSFAAAGSASTWSPFNDGLQLDLVKSALVAPLSGTIPNSCTDSRLGRRAQNGVQIFPGSVPLYRGTTLIGALGISGDGIDQDDMVSFLGASRKGLDFAGHLGVGDPQYGFNAPVEIRSDRISTAVGDLRLRYVNCPEGPFVGTDEQAPCVP